MAQISRLIFIVIVGLAGLRIAEASLISNFWQRLATNQQPLQTSLVSSPPTSNPLLHSTDTSGNDNFHTPTSIRGPVIPYNFPDPSILRLPHTNQTFAFATNNRLTSASSHIHVQVATSSDFPLLSNATTSWSIHAHHDALPHPAPWSLSPGIWAPDHITIPSGPHILYYSAQSAQHPGTHCITAALSPPSAPLGPYTPIPSTIACPIHLGGAIDPDGFFDPATRRRYIIYKIDGNNLGNGGLCRNTNPPLLPTPLMLQEVSARDGITPVASPIEILARTAEDGPLIEAPSLYRTRLGVYFLFYSSNCFTTPGYDVRYATATGVTGPYVRAKTPLLSSGTYGGVEIKGPGGMDVFFGPNVGVDVEDPQLTTADQDEQGQEEETEVLFHGLLSDDDMPDDYDFESTDAEVRASGAAPKRPRDGVIRGMYTARLRFSGREAWIV